MAHAVLTPEPVVDLKPPPKTTIRENPPDAATAAVTKSAPETEYKPYAAVSISCRYYCVAELKTYP